MKVIQVKGLQIGDGIPKICVSLTGRTKEDILEEAGQIDSTIVDIVEWRVDYFVNSHKKECVLQVLQCLHHILEDVPIIFTFRTKNEGGEKEISINKYKELNYFIAESKYADFIDIELFMDSTMKEYIKVLKNMETKVIGSYHNFFDTPKKEEIFERLLSMEKYQVDIVKMAIMPKKEEDVLTLLDCSLEAYRKLKIPMITMSMGKLGVISRICGQLTGSCITFASHKRASAPGQIEAKKLLNILRQLDQSGLL